MSILKTLYDTYEYCESSGLVDKSNGIETVLLPVFHSNIRSTGDNIINIRLDKESNLIGAEYLTENSYVIFPVTINSVSRTSSPAAHPVADQVEYVFRGNEKKHSLYMEALTDFFNYIKTSEEKAFMKVIKTFVENEDALDLVIDSCFGRSKHSRKDLYKVEVEDDKGKVKTIDLKKVFIDFTVVDFKGGENYEISKYKKLHETYIDYVKSELEVNGICNISGKKDDIVNKHRGLMGNAKIISISNNKETYFGRFKTGDDIIHIGYETSEKIHLMLKYFLENRNSRINLGEHQYFINWFDDDISNSVNFNPSISFEYDDFAITGEETKDVAKTFIKGRNTVDNDFEYYTMIIDKSSNGRIAIKYYSRLDGSKLTENLSAWSNKYYWERFNYNEKKLKIYHPSFYEILSGAYGIERNGKLVVENDSFKKDQYQKLIVNMLEGKSIPSNIENAFKNNIRQRRRYKKKWNSMLNTALAVLSKDRKEYINMIPIKEQSISYLYGRLLAIYEKIERDACDNDPERVTNAEKFWSAYINKPNVIMHRLEELMVPYTRKLKGSGKIGILVAIEKDKEEIINAIYEFAAAENIPLNSRLNSDFVFGYYAEKKSMFTKKEDK